MANTMTISDGTTIYYKDWGSKSGQPVVFSHGWPLDADAFEDQLFFLATHGYRCIGHDRRGHGRSEGDRRADADRPRHDDQIVPIKASALPASRIIDNAQLIVYEGGSHGICTTEKNRVCADLLVFIRAL